MKLLDPSAAAMDPLQMFPNQLYSPELRAFSERRAFFNNNDSRESIFSSGYLNADIDMFKSDVYVLGLEMLELGLLIDLASER